MIYKAHTHHTGKKARTGILLYLFLLVFPVSAYTQTYPIQVYTQLIPPYTSEVPSYYNGTKEKLSVTLINTDMAQPMVDVYLRMKVVSSTFSMENPIQVYTPVIRLQAGIPFKLAHHDLAPYFKKENLQINGNQNDFLRLQQLPDNFYRFHFEVYEANTNRLISNPKIGFAQAMIASGEPPLLNLPEKGKLIVQNNIPQIFFSWTPRHMNSVAAAYGTEYEFSLVEIYDKKSNPENAFQYSNVIYTERVRATSLIYSAAHPMLIPGMRYAWRVRAIAKDGIDDANIFKNQGCSEIFWFDNTIDCQSVQVFGAEYDKGKLNITWVNTDAIEYAPEYRVKGTTKWYAAIPLNNVATINNLKAGEEYEYRIGVRCTLGDAYTYSGIKAFKMPETIEKSPKCGLLPDINLTDQKPVDELKLKAAVLVGDFPVFITKVTGKGRFSGEGYVGIPYLQGAQIAVTFKDIAVNSDNRLISGFFETKYDENNNNLLFDGDEFLTGGAGVGDIRTGDQLAEFTVSYTIDPKSQVVIGKYVDKSVDGIIQRESVQLGDVKENEYFVLVLTDSIGGKHELVTSKIPATIQDQSGNIYEVSETGTLTAISKNSDIKLDDKVKNIPRTDIATLEFVPTTDTKYALDPYRDTYAKVTEYFFQYKRSDEDMIASAKLMLSGASDKVEVQVKDAKTGFDPSKVHFVTGKGKEYEATYNPAAKSWTLTLVGSDANDGQELYAVQDMGKKKYATLGKLNIFSYDAIENINVKLVPVNGFTNGFTKESVTQALHDIYGKVGISFKVEMASQEEFSYSFLNGNAFNVGGSGLFSTLTDDMKGITEAYKQRSDYRENSLYLFIIEKATGFEDENVRGDMPRGHKFGYLFGGATVQDIAHEIGHGAFNLEHPFNRVGRNSFEKYALPDNLMDYGDGTKLAKLQWDAVHSPGTVIGLLEKDGDGMYIEKSSVSESIVKFMDLEGSRYLNNKHFMTPSGQIISLPDDYLVVSFSSAYPDKIPAGALIRFMTADRDFWSAEYSVDFKRFLGYASKNKSTKEKPVYYEYSVDRKNIDEVILGFSTSCHVVLKEYFIRDESLPVKNEILALDYFEKLKTEMIGDPIPDLGCETDDYFINDLDKIDLNTLTCHNSKYKGRSWNIPYDIKWGKNYNTPNANYWYKIGSGGCYDYQYTSSWKPVYVVINSPATLNAKLVLIEGETTYFDKIVGKEFYIDKGLEVGSYDLKRYFDIVLKWMETKYHSVNSPNLQAAENMENLARAILKGGELNPMKIFSLDKNKLYSDGVCYYNGEEMSYYLFGYAAYYLLSFKTHTGQAFAIQYLNAEEYDPNPQDPMTDAPWLIKAFDNGVTKAYSNLGLPLTVGSASPMYTEYKLDPGFLTDGITWDDAIDAIDLLLMVYPAASVQKVSAQLTRKAALGAYMNWQVQIIMRIICGMTFEEAVVDVAYGDVFWGGFQA